MISFLIEAKKYAIFWGLIGVEAWSALMITGID
jgi:hypothetical protein